MRKCKQCEVKHGNKAFCSSDCRVAWVSVNNKVNNPVWQKKSLEKMRQSLTGKVQPEETKLKRSKSLRRYYSQNPEQKLVRVKKMHEKHTDKIRGTGWRFIRANILKRDDHKCRSCGDSEKRLDVHHIDHQGKSLPVSKQNNNPNNLVTLCVSCHVSYHSKQRWTGKKVLLVAP